MALPRSVHAAGSDIIKIGMVGCGSRCPGAALNAMNVDPGVRLVAMTDVFPDRVQSRRKMLKQQKPQQVQVDDAHCFSGLDGYRQVIESVDVVLIACAAKFHPHVPAGRRSRPASTCSWRSRTPSIRPEFTWSRRPASWPRRRGSA